MRSAEDEVTILVVDDDQEIVDLIVGSLETEGFATLRAGSGKEALEIIANKPVDLVLTDLRMTPMNGEKLLAEMKARGLEVPVIAISGHGDFQSIKTLLSLGAIDFIEKPLDLTLLLHRVHLAVDDIRTRRLEVSIFTQLAKYFGLASAKEFHNLSRQERRKAISMLLAIVKTKLLRSDMHDNHDKSA